MSSMLVAAIVAGRRGRFYDAKTAEFQSHSSTVGEAPITSSKQQQQQQICDESHLVATKKRLDVRLQRQQTNRSPSKGQKILKFRCNSKKQQLLEEKQWCGTNPKFS